MKTLGIVLPMGQSRKLLERSGQWNLWEQEIAMYEKSFDKVEVFEYQQHGTGRFLEALCMPVREKKRWVSCDVFKAVHLTGSVPCLIGRWIYGEPYILSYGYRYDQFARIDNKWAQWVLVKFLTSIAIRYASIVMVPTRELRDYVESMKARKIAIIPNGVDINIFKGSTLRMQGRTLRVLFVGRLEEQKNLVILIKAVHKISIHIQLIFVGDGTLKKRLQSLARRLKVNLEIKDPIPNDQLPQIYRKVDVFVLPSLAEGHPKVLLEAMSCGIPCLASAIPGTTEIITHGHDGWLVEPTIIGIAQGLDDLIKDRQLRFRLGTEARKTVETRFDKQWLMRKELDLFWDILK